MLEDDLRARGEGIGNAGLAPADIAVDLDETLWEWCSPLLRQPLIMWEHAEYVFVRRPLIWLLQGVTQVRSGQINAWTSGYGYRFDRICAAIPELASLFGMDDQPSESLGNVFTRSDYARALVKRPDLIPDNTHRLVSQKVPGTPTVAGKPAVDAARVLLDDKECNCRRFVAAGEGRSAVWLRGAPRQKRNTYPVFRVERPPCRRWADGVADALVEVASGRAGLFVVDPVDSSHEMNAVRVRLPHRVLWRDWIKPARAIKAARAG